MANEERDYRTVKTLQGGKAIDQGVRALDLREEAVRQEKTRPWKGPGREGAVTLRGEN